MSSNITPRSLEMWQNSAQNWISHQGESGDYARRVVLDPALETILPELHGKTVLDLGCGEGRYARTLKSKGAIVTAIDPVAKFINHAQSLDPESTYIEAFAESVPCPNNHFDLILSYLTIIDIDDLESASKEIIRLLKPGGDLIIVTLSNMASCTDGWHKDENGNKLFRTVDRYMEHFSMDLAWSGLEIVNYHRPLSYVLGLFLNHGFVLTKFIEPLPPKEDSYYSEEFRCPTFQIYKLQKQ